MMYPSNFQKFLTFSMEQPVGAPEINQPKTNKMAATGSQIKLKIDELNTGNAIKMFDAGGIR